MVRLLLHSSEAVYDAATKRYSFVLDERIRRPTQITITKATYANATGAVHPLVVYLESEALSRLVQSKHTMRLKSENHDHQTQVLASLLETHTVGRYAQESSRVLKTDPDLHIKTIDIAFSDNGTLLGNTTSTPSNATGSDDEVLAIGDDLLAFIDFAPARTLSQSFAPLSTEGDTVFYLYNRGPNTNLIFQNNYGNGTQLSAIGQHRGITRQGSWESVVDSTPVDLNNVNDEFMVHSLFKLTSLDWTLLFDVGYMKVYIWGQQLAYEDASGTRQGVLNVIPHVDYLLTVRRRDLNDGANINFEWRLERLDDNTVQTATSGSGLTSPPNANGFAWKWGISSTHFRQVQSCWILHNGLDAAHEETCQTWIRNTYNGTTSASADGAETVTQTASWFVELEVESKE